MGNKNDYLTLEDSARMLGRPLSVVKRVLTNNNISQTYREGHWSIKVRDMEKLRENLPPESEKTVDNPPAEKAANGRMGTATRPTNTRSANKISGGKRTTKPAPIKKDHRNLKSEDRSVILKRIADLDFRIDEMSIDLRQRIDNYQASLGKAGNSKRHKPPTVLLKEWEEAIRKLDRMLERARAMGLTVQTNWGGFKLPPPRQTKATQHRVAGASSGSTNSDDPDGKGSTEKRRVSPEELKELQARTAAYSEKARREAASGSRGKKRTERRHWWNEED